MKSTFPMAMPPTSSDLTTITEAMVEELVLKSRISPRKRMILPFHKSNRAILHRMLNAIQPNSYIRPHRHFTAQKSESILLLRGAICYFTFNDKGEILQTIHLKAGSLQFGVDTEPSVFHTFIAIEADTVIYEAKSGPYLRETDKDFPDWSPAEYTSEAEIYLQQLYALSRVM